MRGFFMMMVLMATNAAPTVHAGKKTLLAKHGLNLAIDTSVLALGAMTRTHLLTAKAVADLGVDVANIASVLRTGEGTGVTNGADFIAQALTLGRSDQTVRNARAAGQWADFGLSLYGGARLVKNMGRQFSGPGQSFAMPESRVLRAMLGNRPSLKTFYLVERKSVSAALSVGATQAIRSGIRTASRSVEAVRGR